ncbi:MAG: carbon-nitrogen hydrolase family protein [Pseudomonadota bacterium]
MDPDQGIDLSNWKGPNLADRHVRVALAQIPPAADVDGACAAAARGGAEIVVFPEMFSNGYIGFDANDPAARQAWIDAAVSLDGPYVDRYRILARNHGLAIVTTFLERGDPRPFSAAALIDRRGDMILHQRKRHICFFEGPEEACAPGEGSRVARLQTGAGEIAIGIMICMDREYPDVASDLVAAGAEIVLIPNACPLVDDPEVGDVRVAGVRAMAFEGVIGMAVTNYPVPQHDGHSFGVDPLGKIIAMGGTDQEIVFVDFDIGAIRSLQEMEWFRRVR